MYTRRSSQIENKFEFDPVFFLLLIMCFLFRYFYLQSSHFGIESDEAIVGLMAKHILEGGDYPFFYYGQHYMGSLEAILTSIVFKFTGITNFGLKFIPLIFSTLCIYPVYRLAQLAAGKNAARIASLIYCFPSQMFLLWSLKTRGGFIEIVFISGLIILLSAKYIMQDKPKNYLLVLIGLLAGLGWWTNNQIIFAIAACGIFLLIKFIRMGFGSFLKSIFIGSFSFILGGLPFWIYNLNNNWISFEKFTSSSSDKDFWKHLHGLYINAFPILLGAKRDWQAECLFKFSSHVVYFLFFVATILILSQYFNLEKRKTVVNLLYSFIFFTGLIFSLTTFGSLDMEPRYIIPMYIAWCAILGIGYSFIKAKGIQLFFICCVLGVNVNSIFPGRFIIAGEPFVFRQERVSKDHTELIEWLNKNNHKVVRTDYWIGYRLAFETKENIKFIIFDEPRDIRIPEYEKLYTGKEPIILTKKQASLVKKALNHLSIGYEEVALSSYIVLYNFKNPFDDLKVVEPDIHKIIANNGQDTVNNIFDHDLETRYASGKAQSPDMWLELHFNKPTKLSGIKYDLGKYIRDAPNSLRVTITDIGDRQHIVCSPEDYNLIKYMLSQRFDFTLRFSPLFIKSIRFEQIGKDLKYDWSIAELGLYR